MYPLTSLFAWRYSTFFFNENLYFLLDPPLSTWNHEGIKCRRPWLVIVNYLYGKQLTKSMGVVERNQRLCTVNVASYPSSLRVVPAELFDNVIRHWSPYLCSYRTPSDYCVVQIRSVEALSIDSCKHLDTSILSGPSCTSPSATSSSRPASSCGSPWVIRYPLKLWIKRRRGTVL